MISGQHLLMLRTSGLESLLELVLVCYVPQQLSPTSDGKFLLSWLPRTGNYMSPCYHALLKYKVWFCIQTNIAGHVVHHYLFMTQNQPSGYIMVHATLNKTFGGVLPLKYKICLPFHLSVTNFVCFDL